MSAIADASPHRLAEVADGDGAGGGVAASSVSLPRLYALRAGYLFVAIGLAVTRWPLLFDHPEPWPILEGAVTCMLVAVSILALLGVRHPLRMLPVMLFESVWKVIWLAVVAVPLWTGDGMDDATWETAFACLLVVVVLAVVPWRYVWAQYVTKPGDRWR